MLIQDLNYLEITPNEVEGASGASAFITGEAFALGDNQAFSYIAAFTEVVSLPNYNLAFSNVLSVSEAL